MANHSCARSLLAPALAASLIFATASPSHALQLTFDAPATATGERREVLTSYRLPTGPWSGGIIPTQLTEGTFDQTSWRIEAPGLSTLQLLAPLRDQITRAGFALLFECETTACGGFDFRYGIEVLPEPEMHVDLGDFRFLTARRDGPKGPEYLSLLISRSADRGFVQLTLVGGEATPDIIAPTAAKSPQSAAVNRALAQAIAEEATTAPKPAATFAERLTQGLTVALDDLIFPSGDATLAPGDYASLGQLADWMIANPDATIALVGHTDASGDLAANTRLSALRAAAVRTVLTSRYALDPARILAQGVGPLVPRAPNTTPEGRQMNRRVEVVLTSTR